MEKKKKPGESMLRTHIGYHLRALSNAVSHSFARKLEQSGVTVAEWVVLSEMHSQSREEVTSPSKISDSTGLTRGAISKLIDRLLHKSLVTRISSASDRRFQEIALTANGRKIVPKLAKIADENDQFFFSILTESERKNLITTLLKLNEFHKLQQHPIE